MEGREDRRPGALESRLRESASLRGKCSVTYSGDSETESILRRVRACFRGSREERGKKT